MPVIGAGIIGESSHIPTINAHRVDLIAGSVPIRREGNLCLCVNPYRRQRQTQAYKVHYNEICELTSPLHRLPLLSLIVLGTILISQDLHTPDCKERRSTFLTYSIHRRGQRRKESDVCREQRSLFPMGEGPSSLHAA